MTQARLIASMDAYGIGTDATISEHISTVKDRGYVTPQLAVTGLGATLVELYRRVNVHFIATSFRAMMEAGLRDVCQGRCAPEELFRELMDRVVRFFGETESALRAM